MHAELDALRAGNPAARVLPLLEALAARQSTRVVLDYLADTRVQVDVAMSEPFAERER
ncbi:3-oxoacyl-[ACP] synthase [Burkholderia cenocepacia KC-01]|nr:3-oxoacyl-[ACP] synthase [Burkholderia cenocepacia KC-01]